MREQLEYLIELAEEDRFGDCSAADRYRLARVALLVLTPVPVSPAARHSRGGWLPSDRSCGRRGSGLDPAQDRTSTRRFNRVRASTCRGVRLTCGNVRKVARCPVLCRFEHAGGAQGSLYISVRLASGLHAGMSPAPAKVIARVDGD
jgi:hypothetical protein